MRYKLKKTGLTSRELMVIGFLVVTFTAGVVIKYSGCRTPQEYDYSETDKNFESKLKSTFEELKQSPPDSISKIRAEELRVLAESLGVETEKTGKVKNLIKPGTKLNLNNSTAAELEMLPGIGRVMAERIVEYRESRGLFRNINEIKNVNGIGDKKFLDIKEFITTE
ncbi:MAG TPA: helix-hairpin-helix domain-containing protein [Ignavibacteria bacterium]|nr:helix-hairpin-helix domain-containing protein [Ignavibacteria bacterium]